MNTILKKMSLMMDELRSKAPLVHSITNYVTVNDVANALLAIGASPIMADDIDEAAEITARSTALVINIGTLNRRTIAAMIASGKRANERAIPVVFDPVGAGASKFRNETTMEILSQVNIAVLRGNLSEVSFVAGLEATTKGVDSSEADEKNDSVGVAKSVAKKFNCVAAVTGAVDVISDGERVVKIANGHRMLSRVTGTGCMTSALVGAFVGTSRDYFTAAVGGVASMGIAGEIAYEKAGEDGTGSFHIAIMDALSKLNGELMAESAKLNEE
ncbi:MAG: hydroxyethylthiazole kinase [Oscillospiraceae bacterium]|nr:hydroxyethylthiazole kinase [Oscillospiraceae bacterium]